MEKGVIEITPEVIKGLYKKVKHRTAFVIMVAKKFDKSPLTVSRHWFGSFWSVPKEYQAEVFDLLNETIESQKVKA